MLGRNFNIVDRSSQAVVWFDFKITTLDSIPQIMFIGLFMVFQFRI